MSNGYEIIKGCCRKENEMVHEGKNEHMALHMIEVLGRKCRGNALKVNKILKFLEDIEIKV